MELNHATQSKQLLTDLISRVRQVERSEQNRTEQNRTGQRENKSRDVSLI